MATTRKRSAVTDLIALFNNLPREQQQAFVALVPEELIANDRRFRKFLDDMRAINLDRAEGQLHQAAEHHRELASLRDATEWSEADLPSRWAKRFGISLGTLKNWIREGKITVDKVSARRWRFPMVKVRSLART